MKGHRAPTSPSKRASSCRRRLTVAVTTWVHARSVKQTEAHMEFGEHFKAVNIGEPTAARGLKVFPLYPLQPAGLPMALLADAGADNDATIAEAEHLGEGAWYRKVLIDSLRTVAVRGCD